MRWKMITNVELLACNQILLVEFDSLILFLTALYLSVLLILLMESKYCILYLFSSCCHPTTPKTLGIVMYKSVTNK